MRDMLYIFPISDTSYGSLPFFHQVDYVDLTTHKSPWLVFITCCVTTKSILGLVVFFLFFVSSFFHFCHLILFPVASSKLKGLLGAVDVIVVYDLVK